MPDVEGQTVHDADAGLDPALHALPSLAAA